MGGEGGRGGGFGLRRADGSLNEGERRAWS